MGVGVGGFAKQYPPEPQRLQGQVLGCCGEMLDQQELSKGTAHPFSGLRRALFTAGEVRDECMLAAAWWRCWRARVKVTAVTSQSMKSHSVPCSTCAEEHL